MKPFLNVKRSWFTISSLVSKDFKLKYRRSILGVAWSVLNPLLMMIVLTAVFSTFFRFSIEKYPVYLILGSTLFSLVIDASSSAMVSVIDSASLIKKIRIDIFIFPLEKVIFQLVNFAISFIAVFAVMIFLDVKITFNLLLLPLLLVYVLIFTLGLSLILSALAVFFRDLIHIWGVLTTAWMYATPLFYPVDILPSWMQTFERFNPMYRFITYYRDIALWGNTPTLEQNIACLAISLIVLAIGIFVFKKLQRKFIFYI